MSRTLTPSPWAPNAYAIIELYRLLNMVFRTFTLKLKAISMRCAERSIDPDHRKFEICALDEVPVDNAALWIDFDAYCLCLFKHKD